MNKELLREQGQVETPDQVTKAGQFRRNETVSVQGSLLISRQPLTALRLNDAGLRLVEALEMTLFQTSSEIADAAGMDRDKVAALLDRLRSRGLVEWRPDRDKSFRPPVSIIVTVRDAAEVLEPCLDALAELSYPTYEVILVDDGSIDSTRDLAHEHRLTEEGVLRVVSVGSATEPLGIGASRNHGRDHAAHDVVAFTDADCRPRVDWLATLVPCLAAHDVVGGRIRPHRASSTDTYEGINSSLDMGEYGARVDPNGGTPYMPTANLVGRRAVFEAVPFQERNVAEDVEFCWQSIADGFDVVYEPAGVVEHAYRQPTRQFAGRRATYAASEGLLASRFTKGQQVWLSVGNTLAVLAALLGLLSGLLVVTTGASLGQGPLLWVSLLVGGAGWLLTVTGIRLWQSYWRLRDTITMGEALASTGRRLLSSSYSVARELARYYTIPLTALGVVVLGVGLTNGSPVVLIAGSALLSIVAIAIVVPLVVEYAIHDPDISLAVYAWWYLWDHSGYQIGAFQGVVAHQTTAHLRPWTRFRLTGLLPQTLAVVRE